MLKTSSQIFLRTFIRFFRCLCSSLDYLHFLSHFSLCLGLLLQAFFRYLMLCCLLLFICEAFESCLGSRVQRQQRAGTSGSVWSFAVGRWCPHAAASAIPTRCCFFEERCLSLSRRQTPRRSCFGERTVDHAVFQFLLLCPAPCVILMPSFEPDISKVTVHLRCCRADGLLPVASLLTVWHFCLC